MVLELAPQENSLVEPHQTILVFVAEAKVVRFHDTQDVTHLHMHGTHTYTIIGNHNTKIIINYIHEYARSSCGVVSDIEV